MASPVTLGLLPCAYLERATAHVLLGWLPKVVDLDVKLTLGRHQYLAMNRSVQLERLMGTMSRLDGEIDLSVPRRWRARLVEVDGLPDEGALLRGLYLELKAELVACYRRVVAGLDRVLDSPLRDMLVAAAKENDAQIRWARRVLGAQAAPRASSAASWIEQRGPRVERSEWLWSTAERVPTPARPAPLATAEDPLPLAIAGVAQVLHESIDADVATMELFARSSYEHADLPESFHRDMSRQASDEARHAKTCRDLAARYGAPYRARPASTQIYDFHYQFGPCRPGSRRELLWRLLLRSTLEKALSLDGFSGLSARFQEEHAPEAARIVASIAADEAYHVEAGLSWSRHLCGGDDDEVYREQESARAYYLAASARAPRRDLVQKGLPQVFSHAV